MPFFAKDRDFHEKNNFLVFLVAVKVVLAPERKKKNVVASLRGWVVLGLQACGFAASPAIQAPVNWMTFLDCWLLHQVGLCAVHFID